MFKQQRCVTEQPL